MVEIDIYVRGAPQNLRETPQVYDPYAVQQSEIFIGDNLQTLLANPQFVRARDDAFDGWTPDVMDIRVTADGSVLVRGNSGEEWRDTHFRTDDREVQQIATKTQEAWRRLQRSRESSRESSPRPVGSHSPLREREVVYEREAPRELTERLRQLERENQDLRSRLDRMELQGQLGALGRQLDDALARLDGANETIRGLADQMRALQAEIREIQRRQDQTNQTLQGAIAVGLSLFATLAQQGQLSREQAATIDRLRADNERLQGTNDALTRDLAAARAATEEVSRAQGALTAQLTRVQEELRQLGSENEGNRRARAQAEGELANATREVERLKGAAKKVAATHAEAVEALEGKVKSVELSAAASKQEVRGLRKELDEKSDALAAEERKTANQARELAALREQVSSLEGSARAAGEREAALRARVRELEGIVGEKEEEARTQQKTLDRLQGDLAAAQEENGSLTKALEAAQTALAKATLEHETSKREQSSTITTLTRQVEELKRKVARAEANEQEQTKALETAEGARRAAEKQSRALAEQLEEVKSAHDTLAKEGEQKDRKIDRLNADLTKAREEQSDAAMQHSEMRKAHEGELKRLDGKVKELTAALKEAEEAQGRVAHENDELRRELREVRQELQTAKDQLEVNKQAQAKLTGKLDHSNEEKKRLSDLLAAIELYEKKCASLRTTPLSFGEGLAAEFKGPKYTFLPGDIKSLIEDLKGQIKALNADKQAARSLEGEIAGLKIDLEDEKAKGERKASSFERQLAEKEGDLEALKIASAAKQKKQEETIQSLRTTLHARKEETEAALAEKERTIGSLKEEIRNLTRTTDQQQETIRTLEAELAALKGRYESLDQEHEDLKAKFSDLEAQHKALLRAHEGLREEQKDSQDRATLYEKQYDEKRLKVLEIENELSKLRLALETLEKKDRALAEENQRLYALFGEGVHTFNEAELALDTMKHKQVRALKQKDGTIAEQQQEIERLLGSVQKTEEKRRAMKAEKEAALKRESETAAELSRAQGRNRALEKELATAQEGRARLQQDVESANEQNASLLREGERQREAMKALAAKNQATVDQLLEQHSAQLLKAQQEAEQAKAELDAEQQKHLSAKEAGEVMAELMEGMDQESLGLSLDKILDRKDFQYVEAYIECANQGNLGRYQGKVDTQVGQYKANPFKLSDLSLFTDFFEVTTHLSRMKTSKEFLRLQSINKVLKTLNTEADRETIARLTKEKQTIIQGLLKTFFRNVHTITTQGNKSLSRYQNIGMALWVWNDTLHGLEGSFYKRASNPERGFKPSIEHKNKTVNLEKLEEMRKTVAQLHTSFRKMLAPFIAK
ncbi:MAG: hypothetical protein H7A38_00495 [Chlamydiales bacterium]|nr:hypothetical protein [Chlamydiales bacterium]